MPEGACLLRTLFLIMLTAALTVALDMVRPIRVGKKTSSSFPKGPTLAGPE